MTLEKNRYRNAPKNADYTIDQAWESYSPEEHDRWARLFDRQKQLLPGRAYDGFIDAMNKLDLSESGGIPNMERLSDRLEKLTGWRVVPVADLVPDEVFFDHLAHKRFPAGAFIRPEAEFDYLQEPDIFHDIFGHVPVLADPVFSEFMQAYGKGGLDASEDNVLPNLARLYWYTVEFGLIREAGELRIFGAGIMSSPAETKFALESDSPNRLGFDLERIMRTDYVIDDFQQTYFVIDSFEELLEACYQDFTPIYQRLRKADTFDAGHVSDQDRVISKGTHTYFKKQSAKANP